MECNCIVIAVTGKKPCANTVTSGEVFQWLITGFVHTWIEVLNDLYSSPNIVPVIKSRRMRWAGHVARMVAERGCIESWWGNRRERDHWGDLGVDGWIILGWISRRWDVGIWTGLG